MESNQKIFNKIEELYNVLDEKGNQKNKAFFSHLIKAYVPLNSTSVAVDKPKNKKVRVRCVFTKKELITLSQAKEYAGTGALRKNMEDFSGTFDSEKGCFISTTPMKQLFSGKVLAIQGKNTETYMSQESFATFINWVMTKYTEGDKHIKWLFGQMSKEKFHPGIIISQKSNKPKTQSNSPKVFSTETKKATLGDLSALQALKDKFKDEE